MCRAGASGVCLTVSTARRGHSARSSHFFSWYGEATPQTQETITKQLESLGLKMLVLGDGMPLPAAENTQPPEFTVQSLKPSATWPEVRQWGDRVFRSTRPLGDGCQSVEWRNLIKGRR